jgi:hypothetical protein
MSGKRMPYMGHSALKGRNREFEAAVVNFELAYREGDWRIIFKRISWAYVGDTCD